MTIRSNKSFLLALLVTLSAGVTQSREIKRFDLHDPIAFPTYAWPRTLLTWQVDYARQDIQPGELRLRDNQTGKSVPFQLSQGQVSFFSDLPSGARRSFSLLVGDQKQASLDLPVTSQRVGRFVEIHNGLFALRIPLSRQITESEPVPGPVYALRRKGDWFGASHILSPQRKVLSLKTECLVQGELYQTWRVTYNFSGGGQYSARIKMISGYDFFEFFEEIIGLNKHDHVSNEMNWTGFVADRRFGTESYVLESPDGNWPAISDNVNIPFVCEDPHWAPSVVEDVSQEMWVKLSPYSANARRELHSCLSFWDSQPQGQELGVFVLDYERWRDEVYGIWQPAQDLMVRFRYRQNTLAWTWPLVAGTRSTAINLNDVAKAEAEVERTRHVYKDALGEAQRMRFSLDTMRLRYNQLLQQRHGPLSLNRAKDWVLQYPDTSRRPEETLFPHPVHQDVDPLMKDVYSSAIVYYQLGQNSWPGANTIQNGFYTGWLATSMVALADKMSQSQRQRLDALILLGAYVTSGDAMHPLRNSLAGCPNMVSNGATGPIIAAFLYPDHPMSHEWRDHYSKYLSLSSHFFTRPSVEKYDSQGGRWTESLSTYNWTHLRQIQAASIAGVLVDGINRWCSTPVAKRGRWLVDMLSAPIYNPLPYQRQAEEQDNPLQLPQGWQSGMPFSTALGFTRQYPAHGAHGSGTAIEPTPVVNQLGYFLKDYDPIVAENLLWIQTNRLGKHRNGHPGWADILEKACLNNNGTEPEFKSVKYTGHGIVLRAGVGTPEELSIHLDQIDRGSNYRWGNPAEGASGSLYYFAGGKVWTGHAREDAGDHAMDDTDGLTLFGVMKDDAYRSIGGNVLHRPLLDLGPAQFAEITARRDQSTYAWPEYDSRSIMLVGTDYFLLFDKTACNSSNGRFSWFIPRSGEYPKIVFLTPNRARPDHWRQVSTYTSKGFQRDSKAHHLALVTHKTDQVTLTSVTENQVSLMAPAPVYESATPKNSRLPQGVYHVDTHSSRDTVLRSATRVRYEETDLVIDGTASVARRKKNGDLELALFEPGHIAVGSISITVDDPNTGLSLVRRQEENAFSGKYQSSHPSKITLGFGGVTGQLYVDGQPTIQSDRQGHITAAFPGGIHDWEFTSQTPQPMVPRILRTENYTGGARIFFDLNAAADNYIVELSRDGGHTWDYASQGAASPVQLTALKNGTKVHLRLIATNQNKRSTPSHAYPLYISEKPPAPPDGLDLVLGTGQVELNWGQKLGVSSYRLYRRQRGLNDFHLLYQGLNRQFTDLNPTVVPPTQLPGVEYNQAYQGPIYEYAVSAVNDNGEGAKSHLRDTDPTTWLNWYPHIEDLSHRRDTEFWKPPYVPARMQPPSHY